MCIKREEEDKESVGELPKRSARMIWDAFPDTVKGLAPSTAL